MKRFLLPFVLALSTAAFAQDRASVEAFIDRYEDLNRKNEFDAALAMFDSTLIWRDPSGLTTYADLSSRVEKAMAETKGKPLPKVVTPSTTTFDRIDVIGNRAIVDLTYVPATTRRGEKAKAEKVHLVMAWRDGAWKFWRVDIVAG